MPQENEAPPQTSQATVSNIQSVASYTQLAVSHTQLAVSHTQLFDQALALQQQQQWDSALDAYQKLLNLGDKDLNAFWAPQAAVVYHNMSTIAHQKGDSLRAYVWSKKSLALDPTNQLAHQSFEQYSKKFEVPLIPHQITNFDTFKAVISKASIDAWLILSFILILTTLWMILKNIVANKKNQLDNDFSTASRWPIYTLGLVTVLILSTTYIRYLDLSVLRGIVIAEKAPVQTAPGENKSVIFEAQAGLELEILKFSQGYYQIRYPGAFSGWVNKSQLEVLGLNFKQGE